MVLNQRLIQFMEIKELKRADYATAMDVNPTLVSKWTQMAQDFPLKHIVKMCEVYPDLNVRWFLTGIGPILFTDQNQNPNSNSTQEPIPPYGECTNPRCTEKIAYLTERVEELRKDKEFLRDMLQRKEVPPENKSEGGVDQAKRAS